MSVHIFEDLDELSQQAARRIAQILATESEADRPFLLALSGGSTPRRLYQILAQRYRTALSESRVHFFWNDERYVAHDNPDSNYRMAFETLISNLPIPEDQVHPVPTDAETVIAAAERYEETLRRISDNRGIDLAILGLGADGHTASLFPGDEVLEEKDAWVRAVQAPEYVSPRARITLTLPCLNQSRNILFLVSGDEKQAALQTLLSGESVDLSRYPASGIRARTAVEWFVDRAAAGKYQVNKG